MNFSSVTRVANRTALKLKKNSPQILFWGGIAGTIGTTVLASRATLRAQPVVEELKFERQLLDEDAHAGRVEQEEYTQTVVRQYTVASVKLSKLYAAPVVLGVVSIAALTKSHQQLTNRNTALTVAYTGLFNTFEKYRGRVRGQLGDQQDQEFLHGTVIETIETEDKNGKKKTKELVVLDKSSVAALSYYFDSNNSCWVPDPGYNQTTIDGVEAWANTLLQKQGHFFLNELYDLLKIPHTREGNILGWVHKDLGNNDTYIDLGHRLDGEFLAGYKKDVMLNFNIHGPILDLI